MGRRRVRVPIKPKPGEPAVLEKPTRTSGYEAKHKHVPISDTLMLFCVHDHARLLTVPSNTIPGAIADQNTNIF